MEKHAAIFSRPFQAIKLKLEIILKLLDSVIHSTNFIGSFQFHKTSFMKDPFKSTFHVVANFKYQGFRPTKSPCQGQTPPHKVSILKIRKTVKI